MARKALLGNDSACDEYEERHRVVVPEGWTPLRVVQGAYAREARGKLRVVESLYVPGKRSAEVVGVMEQVCREAGEGVWKEVVKKHREMEGADTRQVERVVTGLGEMRMCPGFLMDEVRAQKGKVFRMQRMREWNDEKGRWNGVRYAAGVKVKGKESDRDMKLEWEKYEEGHAMVQLWQRVAGGQVLVPRLRQTYANTLATGEKWKEVYDMVPDVFPAEDMLRVRMLAEVEAKNREALRAVWEAGVVPPYICPQHEVALGSVQIARAVRHEEGKKPGKRVAATRATMNAALLLGEQSAALAVLGNRCGREVFAVLGGKRSLLEL